MAEHPELPPAEREMLLGWQDVVEGLFEVQQRAGEALVVTSLVDELTYRVRSNMGARILGPLHPGSFFGSRLVPAGDERLLSDVVRMLPGRELEERVQAQRQARNEQVWAERAEASDEALERVRPGGAAPAGPPRPERP